jgi:hypothetical protein
VKIGIEEVGITTKKPIKKEIDVKRFAPGL